MNSLITMLLLPLRAPKLLLLLLISVYLGLHWSRPDSAADSAMGSFTTLIWSAECLQALVIVVVCTVPDLLLRRIASMMAASRVLSLVVTLLTVITGGLYLLHLDVLSNVIILGSAVLLARLDLVRLRLMTPPFLMTVFLSVLVLGGVNLGRTLEVHLRSALPAVHHTQPAPPHASSSSSADAKDGQSAEANAKHPQQKLPNRSLPRHLIQRQSGGAER
jgi:hypothetical protein